MAPFMDASRIVGSRLKGRVGMASLALLAVSCSPVVSAQAYPSKPIRLIIPSSAGGGIDLLARIMAPRLSELMG